jgi:hypothetical protein
MTISNKLQIEVLKEALIASKNDIHPFVCVDSSYGLDKFKISHRYSDIPTLLPLLTFENAMLVCKRYKLKQPKMECESGGWWETGLRKPRIAFINWMIRETRNKIKLNDKRI